MKRSKLDADVGKESKSQLAMSGIIKQVCYSCGVGTYVNYKWLEAFYCNKCGAIYSSEELLAYKNAWYDLPARQWGLQMLGQKHISICAFDSCLGIVVHKFNGGSRLCRCGEKEIDHPVSKWSIDYLGISGKKLSKKM